MNSYEMMSCWSPDASDRPTFQHLAESLEALPERESGYLKLFGPPNRKSKEIRYHFIMKLMSIKYNFNWAKEIQSILEDYSIFYSLHEVFDG